MSVLSVFMNEIGRKVLKRDRLTDKADEFLAFCLFCQAQTGCLPGAIRKDYYDY